MKIFIHIKLIGIGFEQNIMNLFVKKILCVSQNVVIKAKEIKFGRTIVALDVACMKEQNGVRQMDDKEVDGLKDAMERDGVG